jgi:hypothetical protein
MMLKKTAKKKLHTKISARHLERCAYVYVRQSTQKQVRDNHGSRENQYALLERAIELWAGTRSGYASSTTTRASPPRIRAVGRDLRSWSARCRWATLESSSPRTRRAA